MKKFINKSKFKERTFLMLTGMSISIFMVISGIILYKNNMSNSTLTAEILILTATLLLISARLSALKNKSLKNNQTDEKGLRKKELDLKLYELKEESTSEKELTLSKIFKNGKEI